MSEDNKNIGNTWSKYVYTNKSKKLTFNLNELTDEEKKKFNKLNDTQKRQFIAAFKLNEEVQFPDEVQIKTTKEYSPNERYNKLVITKTKSDELNNFIKKNPGIENEKVKDIKDIILRYTDKITADDLAQAIAKNEDITISDLNKLYIDKVKELNISQAENVNISQANKVNFDKLLLDVNKLTSIIDDPLKNSLKEIVNKYSDNNEIIEAADKNDIAKLITELEKQRDTKLLDEIKGNIDYLQIQLDNIFGNVGMTQDELLEILKNKDDVKELKEMINSEFKDMKDLIKVNETLNEIMKKTNEGTITHEKALKDLLPIVYQIYNAYGRDARDDTVDLKYMTNIPTYIYTDPETGEKSNLYRIHSKVDKLTDNDIDILTNFIKMADKLIFNPSGTSKAKDERMKKFRDMLVQIKNILYPEEEGEGIKDFFKGVKNIPEIESMKNELIKINERLSKLETSNFQPSQFQQPQPVITSQNDIGNTWSKPDQFQPQKPEFLNSITQPVKLKPLDIEVDNGFKKTRQEEEQGILKDLSEIMSRRRQDLEPDEAESSDDEWAEGLRKNNFKGLKLYSLNDLLK